MPLSPALSENLAREVVELYAQAEATLLRRIALHVGAGMEAPDWVERKLAEVQFLTAQARRLVDRLDDRAAAQVALDLVKAYNRGGAAAAADLARLVGTALEETATPVYGLPAVEVLVGETCGLLQATDLRILRSVEDIYRQVLAETAAQAMIGVHTRRQAAQRALDRFADRGITGFVDRAGKNWSLSSYTEMAMRSATARAAIQGHTTKLQEHGFDLVIVSDVPQECGLCREWEGKVLSLSGRDPDHPSMEQARQAGLFHPGCRHAVSLYQEGVTRPMHGAADPEGDEARREQRYLERQIRAYKRREAVALDDGAKKKAQAKIREYQARLRKHVEANDLKRLRYREQITRAI